MEFQRPYESMLMPTDTTSETLTEGMLQQRKQREIKAIGKATEAAREAYEGLPI